MPFGSVGRVDTGCSAERTPIGQMHLGEGTSGATQCNETLSAVVTQQCI